MASSRPKRRGQTITESEKEYEAARRRIRQALEGNRADLDLSVSGLETIPEEIERLRGSLQWLDLTNTGVSDLSPLRNLTALTELDLSGTQVTDLSPLQNLTALTRLYLSRTQITDLSPLQNLTALTGLDLSGTQVTDLSPLQNLTALTGLYLSGTQVTDLSPLQNLTALTELYLSGTQVTDPTPILGLQNLEYLYIDGTPLAASLDGYGSEIASIEDTTERGRATLPFLRENWPPPNALPEDRPGAPHYTVPPEGPITATGARVGPNDPEQQALQIECRDKIRALIASIREGDNELAPLIEAAQKYRDLIDREGTDILASTLWSAANTLRARHEAHLGALETGRINNELPPEVAAPLLDLLQTHGLFFLGHPGAAEVERKAREFLTGTRNPEARVEAETLAASLKESPAVLAPEAATALDLDRQAAASEGPSGEMGERALLDRLQNIVGSIARWAKAHPILSVIGTGAAAAATPIAHHELVLWWERLKPVIKSFYKYLDHNLPLWLGWLENIMAMAARLL